ncbi:MAG: response regulator transcription factor [Proteobacteria bacterium]|nr:response regulator transcription factor [Pseudomonadota bacterium]
MNVLLNFTSSLINELFYDYLRNCGSEITPYFNVEKKTTPDIILLDYNSLNNEIQNKYPKAKLVLVDTSLKKEQLITALGVYKLAGIISTDTDKKLFVKALQVINEGQIWIDNKLLKNFINNLNLNKNISNNGLTEQEKNIVKFVCEGLSNKQIAVNLSISEQTVKSHLNRVFKKLNITNRAQLVSLCKDNCLNL